MLQGFATEAGTAAYSQRHGVLPFQTMGKTGLQVSGAGFGSYRIHDSVAAHREAVAKALRSGINIIDTSANYTDGGSERLIGQVLQELAATGEIRREEIVVVSKGGYLQGENYRLSQERQRAGRPLPELVPYEEGLEHCIHPHFLAEQIDRSLARLQLTTLDCYLLHNPEYYLKWAESMQVPVEEAQAEYLRRLREAFLHLETEVARGRIRWYGISSNTFVVSAADYAFTSLTEVWEMAEEMGPDHHFRVIEFPCNLFETAAVTLANQAGGASVVDVALRNDLAVLINRPLNAIQGNGLIRLAEGAYQEEAAQAAAAFRREVAALDPEWQQSPSLAQLALRALRSTRGITTVLVGMRQVSYVDDVLQELQRPCRSADRKGAWDKLREMIARR